MLKFLCLIVCTAASSFGYNERPPRNCEDLQMNGNQISGVYTVFPNGVGHFPNGENSGVKVLCDMETDGGGWTVIQKRQEPYSADCVTSFERNWDEYANGFGNIEGDFWQGLNHVHNLTRVEPYQLRIDLKAFDGEERYATYGNFHVASEPDQFKLTVSGYGGDAGDGLEKHNGMMFSTKDRDNDEAPYSCAQRYNGAWWYYRCHTSNLNGRYVMGGTNFDEATGVTWYPWRGNKESLKQTEMKIRSWDFLHRVKSA